MEPKNPARPDRTEEREQSTLRSEHAPNVAQPQDGSTKVHGDKLDPIIPRGTDQKAG
jgi:hypothetical protein